MLPIREFSISPGGLIARAGNNPSTHRRYLAFFGIKALGLSIWFHVLFEFQGLFEQVLLRMLFVEGIMLLTVYLLTVYILKAPSIMRAALFLSCSYIGYGLYSVLLLISDLLLTIGIDTPARMLTFGGFFFMALLYSRAHFFGLNSLFKQSTPKALFWVVILLVVRWVSVVSFKFLGEAVIPGTDFEYVIPL